MQAQGETFDLLRRLVAEGVGVLVAMHDLTLAAAYCDRLVLLADGRVVAAGTPAEVITTETVTRVYGPRVTTHGTPVVVPAIMEATNDR